MSGNEQIIEAEVVEIDGIIVEPRPVHADSQSQGGRFDGSAWQGRLKHLDIRWWPLWIVLGFVALVVAVVVGTCVAVFFVAWRIFKAILNGFVNLFSPQQ